MELLMHIMDSFCADGVLSKVEIIFLVKVLLQKKLTNFS